MLNTQLTRFSMVFRLLLSWDLFVKQKLILILHFGILVLGNRERKKKKLTSNTAAARKSREILEPTILIFRQHKLPTSGIDNVLICLYSFYVNCLFRCRKRKINELERRNLCLFTSFLNEVYFFFLYFFFCYFFPWIRKIRALSFVFDFSKKLSHVLSRIRFLKPW